MTKEELKNILITENMTIESINSALNLLKRKALNNEITKEDSKFIFEQLYSIKNNLILQETPVLVKPNLTYLQIVAPTENNQNFAGPKMYFKLFSTKMKEQIDHKHGPCWRISISAAKYIFHRPRYKRAPNGDEINELIKLLNMNYLDITSLDRNYNMMAAKYKKQYDESEETKGTIKLDDINLTLWQVLLYKIDEANHFDLKLSMLSEMPDYEDLKKEKYEP